MLKKFERLSGKVRMSNMSSNQSGSGSWSSLIVQGFEIRVYSGEGDGEPAVCIQPEGTGDHNSGVSDGFPVVVEFYDGKPRVHVWADINQEDSTHTIELDGALESRRAAEQPYEYPEPRESFDSSGPDPELY
jgi:hypothetical protein